MNLHRDLTPREHEVLTLTLEGYMERQIAARLGISLKTVEAHKSHIRAKWGLRPHLPLMAAIVRYQAEALEEMRRCKATCPLRHR